MLKKRLLVGGAIALAVSLCARPAWAGDTAPRDFSGHVHTMMLAFDGQADTVPVRWHHHYHGGFYRPYYRPYYAGFYYPRRYYGYPYRRFGFYSSSYRPYYYAPLGHGYAPLYYPAYYSTPLYSYAPLLNLYPFGGPLSAVTSTPLLRSQPSAAPTQPQGELLPPPTALPDDSTYPYDGGPEKPVPIPGKDSGPAAQPTQPKAQGRFVSLPAQPSKFRYPPYGQYTEPARSADERIIQVKDSTQKPAR